MTITTKDLFYVFQDGSVGLAHVDLDFPSGSRVLLIGANGAGKSTLLRVLAGKTLAKAGAVAIDGADPFREATTATTYLGTEWIINSTVRRDIGVALLIASVGGDAYPDRRDELVDILDIDLTWHMNRVSDGERRRVQLCMGLLRPWNTLLLDEVTVDLDVLVRSRLLDFLERETASRNCQIVYATHIFDGLQGWPTHIVHMHLGTILETDTAEEMLSKYSDSLSKETRIRGSPLLQLALRWLGEDLESRGSRQKKPQWSDVEHDLGLENSQNFGSYFKAIRGRPEA